VLPVFQQWQFAPTRQPRLTILEPLPAFRQQATLGSINIQPDSDGLVRRYRGAASLAGDIVPAFATALAGEGRAVPDEVYLDYGIAINELPRISFVDVLTGNFDPSSVAGRPVIIGATAVELGDQVAVPVHGVLPGPVLQALAHESLFQGRTLHRSGPWVMFGVALLLVTLLGPLYERASWRRGLILTFVGTATLVGIGTACQWIFPLILDVVPWVVLLTGMYAESLIRRLDQQALGLLTQLKIIRRTESLMHHIVANSFDAIVTVDAQGAICAFNRSAEKMFGAREGDVIGRRVREFVRHPDPNSSKSLLRQAMRSPTEAVGRTRDGRELPVEVVVTEIGNGAGRKRVAFLRDITERKVQQEQLRHQATHDPLTKLPNRFLIHEQIGKAIEAAGDDSQTVAVLMLDLDRFKEINDALGHRTGDQLLQKVARRLSKPLDASATIARLGGDEFAVLLPITTLERALQTAWSLIEALRTPFEVDELSLQVDTSLGITLYPDHGHDADTLLQRADVAMYVAKQKRSSITVYRPEQDFNSKRHLMLRADLRQAIHEDLLTLAYQPKIDAATDNLIAAEALVRWNHPEHGSIPPDEFIGLAEHTGLIRALTQRVLEAAVRQMWQWKREGFEPKVSVNLSARNLLEEDLPHNLSRLLARYGVPPEQLTLEITESVIMEDPERALTVVTRLESIGVSISIDDFGTGYSSLGYLMRLPAREIKIDKSFVMNMDSDPGNATIVRSTIELAHNLGLEVVAEGVETLATWNTLKELGCDIGQGFYFSKPLPPEKLPKWVANQATAWAFATSVESTQDPVGIPE